MRLIIDIPEKVNEHIRSAVGHGYYPFFDDDEGHIVGKAISNGTPLPKGHGRLIDADAYRKEMLDSREFDFFKRLDMQPTIIEADKAESEDKG